MTESPFKLVIDTLWGTVEQMFGWFGLTPLGVVQALGVFTAVVIVYQVYRARKDGGRFTFDE